MSKSIKQPDHSDLKQDHECFKQAIMEFKDIANKIEINTKQTADVLPKMHEDSNEHLKLIAGRKQVPLSIFIIIVVVLSGLLIATEVKYSGISIDIGWDHIKVTSNK